MKQPVWRTGRVYAALIVCFACLLTVPAAGAQTSTRPLPAQPARIDIQRLQDTVYDVGTDIGRLRPHDAARADGLQARLDDLRDEVVYLKVKQRKEGVSNSEYTALREPDRRPPRAGAQRAARFGGRQPDPGKLRLWESAATDARRGP